MRIFAGDIKNLIMSNILGNMKKILFVEDDKNLSFIIKENLEDLGYEVCHIVKGEEAIEIIKNVAIDIIIMDVELSGEMDGFETAEEIRKYFPSIPIIFATGRNSGKDIERGFKIEHMDYVKKPFGIKEISFRINGLLGAYKKNIERISIGSFTFDPLLHKLFKIQEEIRLSSLESDFLDLLLENEGKVVSKEHLIMRLWDDVEDIKDKDSSLHNLAYKLRTYFKDEDAVSIEVISKQGYRLILKQQSEEN
jgi:DNA-binding response OmpR family regulator